ncbi:MAG: hypothetical protein VYB74_04230, partial [Cyanobacteriota bacterium]|nr:hypothetical protein [Cyanobacteriota bacterium]
KPVIDAKCPNVLQMFKKIGHRAASFGMDTLAFRSDPTTPGNVANVFTDFAKFKLEEVRSESKTLRGNWDRFATDDNDCLTEMILESLSQKLRENVEYRQHPDDTAADLLMHIVQAVQPVTNLALGQHQDDLEAMKLVKFPQQNVERFCAVFLKDVELLLSANFYDPDATMSMLQALLDAAKGHADGEGNEEFRDPLKEILRDMKKIADEKSYLNLAPHQKEAKMEAAGFGIRKVLFKAEMLYRSQVAEHKWAPALHARDVAVPKANLGQVQHFSGGHGRPRSSQGRG